LIDRQTALVLAAYRLVAERGFEGLRTRDIAGSVGVNIATLHYYFPTKESLIRAVVGHAMSRFRTTLQAHGDPAGRLQAHLGGLRTLARKEPELFAVMGELSLRARRDRTIAKIVAETEAVWHRSLRALLRAAGKDPDAAPLIVAALKGAFMVPADARDTRAFDAVMREIEALVAR
jgi:AcrR family transcriptional regulator